MICAAGPSLSDDSELSKVRTNSMFGVPVGDTALTAASNSSLSRSLLSRVVVAGHGGKPVVSSAINGNFASCDAPAPRRKMTLLKVDLSLDDHEAVRIDPLLRARMHCLSGVS